MRLSILILAVAVVLTAAVVAEPQQSHISRSPQQRPQRTSDQMKTGAFAVVSDQAGTLFVDSVEAAKLVPDKVVTLELVAGQHFAELHDANNQKRWEKVIDVPVGAQLAGQIHLHSTTSLGGISWETPETSPGVRTASTVGPSQLSNGNAWIESTIAPFQRVVSAADEPIPFQSLRGSRRGDKKSWNGTIVLPGAKGCFAIIGSAGWPEYVCVWQYSSDSDARLCYDNWRALIEQDGGWITTSPPIDKDLVQGISYHTRKQNELFLGLHQYRSNAVAISFTAFVPKTRHPR